VPPGIEARSASGMAARACARIAGRPRKRLKDLCQEAGIVPWLRDACRSLLGRDGSRRSRTSGSTWDLPPARDERSEARLGRRGLF
jgi:hypothetical protein